jgi:cyclophilin family peptidyl-prolyl cis-trans isomerase
LSFFLTFFLVLIISSKTSPNNNTVEQQLNSKFYLKISEMKLNIFFALSLHCAASAFTLLVPPPPLYNQLLGENKVDHRFRFKTKHCTSTSFPTQQPRSDENSRLYNFLDDFKESQDTEGQNSNDDETANNTAFPPAICPSEIFRIRFCTTAGDFTVRLDRALSPSGVTRFLELVDDGFFNGQYIYRVDPGFIIQFGVSSDPLKQSQWDPRVGAPIAPIPDEPNRQQFKAGSVSFAGSGVNARSCHVFIALEPFGITLGDAPHEAVLGNIEEEDGGMFVLDQLVRNREDQGHGELLHVQGALSKEGSAALDEYPGIDQILSCGRF